MGTVSTTIRICARCVVVLSADDWRHATNQGDPDHLGICCDCFEAQAGRPRKPYPTEVPDAR